MGKTFLLFFGAPGQNNNPIPDPQAYSADSIKLLLKEIANKGWEVYVSNSYNAYQGGNKYKVNWRYEKGSLLLCDDIIEPDSVFDKSKKIYFPDLFSKNVLNTLNFKMFCKNKWLGYLAYPEFFPKTKVVLRKEELDLILKDFENFEKVVVKDSFGLAGEKVEFFDRSEFDRIGEFISTNPETTFLIQEFRDTSKGFGTKINSTHDLRFIILNEEIITVYVRTPKIGLLKANFALGGDFQELQLIDIPVKAIDLVNSIAKEFFVKFNNPFFSIDLGIDSNGNPFVFEFNDQVGFPGMGDNEAMWREKFIKSLADRLTLSRS